MFRPAAFVRRRPAAQCAAKTNEDQIDGHNDEGMVGSQTLLQRRVSMSMRLYRYIKSASCLPACVASFQVLLDVQNVARSESAHVFSACRRNQRGDYAFALVPSSARNRMRANMRTVFTPVFRHHTRHVCFHFRRQPPVFRHRRAFMRGKRSACLPPRPACLLLRLPVGRAACSNAMAR